MGKDSRQPIKSFNQPAAHNNSLLHLLSISHKSSETLFSFIFGAKTLQFDSLKKIKVCVCLKFQIGKNVKNVHFKTEIKF
jgi:hypothetical protein